MKIPVIKTFKGRAVMYILLLLVPLTSCTEKESRGNPTVGETKTSACIACHGRDGNPMNPDFPTLAGKQQRYLVDAMKAYQDGRRDDATMTDFLAPMTERDLEDIAAFYASQRAR
jgi:cytochrome c553